MNYISIRDLRVESISVDAGSKLKSPFLQGKEIAAVVKKGAGSGDLAYKTLKLIEDKIQKGAFIDIKSFSDAAEVVRNNFLTKVQGLNFICRFFSFWKIRKVEQVYKNIQRLSHNSPSLSAVVRYGTLQDVIDVMEFSKITHPTKNCYSDLRDPYTLNKSPVECAIEVEDLDKLTALADQGADVTSGHHLMQAVSTGNVDLVNFILSKLPDFKLFSFRSIGLDRLVDRIKDESKKSPMRDLLVKNEMLFPPS